MFIFVNRLTRTTQKTITGTKIILCIKLTYIIVFNGKCKVKILLDAI